MGDLAQLFTKEVEDRLEPLTFFLHCRLGNTARDARRIILRHGGVVVDTRDPAEIIVASRTSPSYTKLLRKYAREGDLKTVETIQSISEWVQRRYVLYEYVNRRRRGGRKFNYKPIPFNKRDLENEAKYVLWVYRTSETPRKELRSDSIWKERRRMGGPFAWMRTHPFGAWSRRHRKAEIVGHYRGQYGRYRRLAEQDNEVEEVIVIDDDAQALDDDVEVEEREVLEILGITTQNVDFEQSRDSHPPTDPSPEPPSRAGPSAHRRLIPQNRQARRPSPYPSPPAPSQQSVENRLTNTSRRVDSATRKALVPQTPVPAASRARLETPSRTLVADASGAGPSRTRDNRPRDVVTSASRTFFQLQPWTGSSLIATLTRTEDRPPFPSPSSLGPGTTLRPNRIENRRPQGTPSRANGPAGNLAEGDDNDIEPFPDPSRLLFGNRALSPDDAATEMNIIRWNNSRPSSSARAQSGAGPSASNRR